MNDSNNINIVTTLANSPDLHLSPPSPGPFDVFRPTQGWHIQPINTIRPSDQAKNNNSTKKKRTKMIRFHNTKPVSGVGGGGPGGGGLGPSSSHSGVVAKKKPDPSAPKITRPCTECGKRFWSWKALFGHMRCHPERPWRGINPPPNMHMHPVQPPDHRDEVLKPRMMVTEEDEYVAACLLMLANTPTGSSQDALAVVQVHDAESRFECSSCKKVFGSHQALGGHRASHKNVKGCFAITRTDAGTEELEYGDYSSGESLAISQQHKCSICLKIFSSGQALGGHKRCHLENKDYVVPTATTTSLLLQPFRFDLNSSAVIKDDHATCSSSDLDLRLCL